MSDCDVCIGGFCDGEMAEFCETIYPKARKPHKCCECRRMIAKGEKYERTTGKWEGEIMTLVTCLLCEEIRTVFTCEESWTYSLLWEGMAEYAFPKLTTASPCFTKLSPAAKQFVLDKWAKWKGLK